MNETRDTSAPAIRYGGFNTRMMAATIDLALIYTVALPLVELITDYFFAPVDGASLMQVLGAPELQGNTPAMISALWKALGEQHIIGRMMVENLLQVFFIALYTLPFWFGFSSTPGKMLFRLRIEDEATGAPMSRSQALVRFLGYFASTLPLSMGFLYVAFNKKRRGFHDCIAGTVVVVKPKSAKAKAA